MNENLVRFLIDFVGIFIIMYLVYTFIINKKKRDYGKLKKRDLVKIFIEKYKLDMRKTEYKKVLNIVNIISSFIIAFASALILNVRGTLTKLGITVLVVIVFLYTLFDLAGKYLKNKEEK